MEGRGGGGLPSQASTSPFSNTPRKGWESEKKKWESEGSEAKQGWKEAKKTSRPIREIRPGL